MDDCVRAVAFQQLLFDQIDMRNLRGQLLNIAVVLNIKAIWDNQPGNRAGCIHILRAHPNSDFTILHKMSSLFSVHGRTYRIL